MTLTASVVIPTYNRRELVLDAVGALDRQQSAPPFEVIVVVDGSTDGTRDAVVSLQTSVPVRVVEQGNAGAAAARNAGAKMAQGELVLFLDDDMEADRLLVRAHVDAHAAGADVVVGSMPLHPRSTPTLIATGVGEWAAAWARELSGERPLRWFDVLTGNLSVRRSLFERLGGFCIEYNSRGRFGNEDLEFGLRVFAAGSRVEFAADAIALQRYEKSAGRYLDEYEDRGAADVRLACRWPATASYVFSEQWDSSELHQAARLFVAIVPGLARRFAVVGGHVIEQFVDDGRRSAALDRALYAIAALRYHLGVRAAGGRPTARRIVALAFHSVADHRDHPSFAPYAIEPACFASMLDGLSRSGYAFVSAEQVISWRRGEQDLPRRAVLVTFDDAYEDIATAATILEERDVPAVVFVPTSFIGRDNDWETPGEMPRKHIASESELRQLAERGIELASHGSRHVDLTSLSSLDLRTEVDEASECLERIRGTSPRLFAYPYGVHDPRVNSVLARAGIEAAFTVEPGPISASDPPMTLRRLELSSHDTGPRVRWKLTLLRSGAWRLYPALHECRKFVRRSPRNLARRVLRLLRHAP
jgi:peptidoglycan/xylan/chitin deacetylase (PgdA/CDA1 family)/GT2 family glycosyltransferase